MKACVFQIGETQQTKCFRAVSFPVERDNKAVLTRSCKMSMERFQGSLSATVFWKFYQCC